MVRTLLLRLLLLAAVAAPALAQNATTMAPSIANSGDLQTQVADTERAFAKSMADRDFAAFASFISPEAIFFSGAKALRGKPQVTASWKRFYEKPDAPFSWRPETVEVLDSGTLALSTGPVFDAAGKQVATFTSIWRQDAPGVWHIVYDKGNDVCDCAKEK